LTTIYTINLVFISSSTTSTTTNGTLAEWLTRGPAKPVPSGASVRITQVSILFDFFYVPPHATVCDSRYSV
jgi:hypothetical protein